MKRPRGFAYACLPSRALLTPQSKRFQRKKIQTKRIVYCKQFENSLFKISNAAKLFENLIVESVCFRALEFDNQTT